MRDLIFTKSRHQQQGFTLIEIMIAIFLVGIGIIGLAMLTTTTSQDNDFSKTITSATTLARDKIEELKGTDFASLAAGSDTSGIYTRNWTVTQSAAPSNYKVIAVSVTWKWQGQTHEVALNTIRAQD